MALLPLHPPKLHRASSFEDPEGRGGVVSGEGVDVGRVNISVNENARLRSCSTVCESIERIPFNNVTNNHVQRLQPRASRARLPCRLRPN